MKIRAYWNHFLRAGCAFALVSIGCMSLSAMQDKAEQSSSILFNPEHTNLFVDDPVSYSPLGDTVSTVPAFLDESRSSSASTTPVPATEHALNASMQKVMERVIKIMEADESQLSTLINGYKASDISCQTEGDESFMALQSRVTAAQLLIERGIKVCDSFERNESTRPVDSLVLNEAANIGHCVEGATQCRAKYVEQIQKMMGSLQKQKNAQQQVSSDDWKAVLKACFKSSIAFKKEVSQNQLKKEIKECQKLFEAIVKDMPYATQILGNGHKLTDEKKELLKTHFAQINYARSWLHYLTKKFKHMGWGMTSIVTGAKIGLPFVVGGVAMAPIVAWIAVSIVALAVISSLAYKIYSTYHKAKILSAVTDQSLLQSIKIIVWEDMPTFGRFVKGLKDQCTRWIEVNVLDKEKIASAQKLYDQAKKALIEGFKLDALDKNDQIAYLEMIKKLTPTELKQLEEQRIKTMQRQKKLDMTKEEPRDLATQEELDKAFEVDTLGNVLNKTQLAH